MENKPYSKGLEGVVADESRICKIDGANGKLYYRGYSIEDLAAYSNYEEVCYLLLYEKLPTTDELKDFSQRMRESRPLVQPVLDMIRSFPDSAHPMELLQSSVSYLSGYVKHRIEHSATCNCRNTLYQVSQLAGVVATYGRYRERKEYLPPRMDLSHGANFLYMLHGSEPDPVEGEIMDKCLLLHAEHDFNASTFAARVVASTLSTCYCSISSAVGALYGSLHGGANQRVVEMAEEIGDKNNVAPWMEKAFAQKRKVMGMGHREYKAKDPRANIIQQYLVQLSEKKQDFRYYEILQEVEKVFRGKMETAGKPIYPNVDFYSGAVYRLLGIPAILFTPIFAMGRVAGWLAHILEQRSDNRIYRPESLWTGPEPRAYVPIEKR
ncbi:MAG: citrate/2-methylcitrate synthase [Syntrophaceae bacterium]|jgi:citrate synthase|nr:citrate/2-methylcitrate synthase [Syntrophaceae bacterium]